MPKPTARLPKSLKEKTAQAVQRTKPPRESLWNGPEKDGITQSLLSRYLCCRERFRLKVVEGLSPRDEFNKRLEYGNMWHVCEEGLAKGGTMDPVFHAAFPRLRNYSKELQARYPLQQQEILKWENVCKLQFPVYVDYWRKHKDTDLQIPLLQEYAFAVPYKLPSGRVVKLRGKWDSVFATKGSAAGIWIQENKSKGDIDERGIQSQLTFDLQTMIYFIAFQEFSQNRRDPVSKARLFEGLPLRGVLYNVIRRPLSGGKHSIVQHKPTKSKPNGESSAEYYARLQELIESDPEFYFMRWKVDVTQQDVERFKTQFLHPALEGLCDWWEWIAADPFNPFRAGNRLHFTYPQGVYNVTLEGGASELDEHLNTGSTVGLERSTNLFPELT